MNIQTENQMEEFIRKFSYIVIFPDKKVELFKSLRDIQESVMIDASTISKKLKNNEYLFTSKSTGFIFYITRLKVN